MTTISAIQNRFDAQAAVALEALIKEVEDANRVKATEIEVELIPMAGESPAVDVSLQVRPEKP